MESLNHVIYIVIHLSYPTTFPKFISIMVDADDTDKIWDLPLGSLQSRL